MLAFPNELLWKIFELDDDPAVLMVLAAVCRRWKGVAYDASLWTHVSITKNTRLPQLRAQLDRSRSRPLDVRIWFKTSHFTANLRELCQHVLAEFWRLEHLFIETSRSDDDYYDDVEPWPAELTVPLTSGNTWPLLQSLRLAEFDSPSTNAALQVNIDAPRLQTFGLSGVSISQWPSMRVGPALRTLEIRLLASASGIVDALRSCTNLVSLTFECRELPLNEPEPLHFAIPRSMAPFTDLVHLRIVWATIDLLQILSFLRLCPRLEFLLLRAEEFTDHENAVGTDFQLPSLEALHLEALLTDSPARNILRALLPALNTAVLQDLSLCCVDIDSCAAVLGPNLQNLALTDVRLGDAAKLFRAIGQCHQLRTLALRGCEMSSLDEQLETYGQRLPALQDVSLALFDTGEAPGPTPEQQAANSCLVRLVLSLADGPRLSSLHIASLSLTTQDVVHICQEIGAQVPLSLQIRQLRSDCTCLVIGHTPSEPHEKIRPFRTFDVESLLEPLRALSTTVDIFALIASLSLDMRSAVDFFAALPSAAARMPRLGQLTLELRSNGDGSNDCDVPTVLGTIVGLRGGIDCPSLRTVTLVNSSSVGVLPSHMPSTPRVPRVLVDQFVDSLRSRRRVKVLNEGFMVLPEPGHRRRIR